LADLQRRDQQDMSRQHAPLKPAQDAVLLDNSEQTIDQSVQTVLNWWNNQRPFKRA
jgi:3-phosphoshikimate 1-carboxyvinyltransferase